MIIDFHTYVGKSLLGYSLSPEDLLASMENLGIDAAVACPMKGLDPYYFEPNERIAALQERYAGKLYGYARIDPHLGERAEAVLAVALDEWKLHGLALHPWEETFAVNDPIVFPFVRMTAERGLPIMLETGYPMLSHPMQSADLARRFPGATFIMTHGGQLDGSGYSMTDAEYVMRRTPNLIMETSGLFADELLERLPKDLGADRMVFGSHSPWLNQALELKRIQRAHISDGTREAIWSGTAKKLLGL